MDAREETIRKLVYEALDGLRPAETPEHFVATYFVHASTLTCSQVGEEISYHMTSGVRAPRPGSLLETCTGKVVDAVAFDREDRCGIVRVAFPLKMLIHEDGSIYSTDLLHVTAGEGVFGLTENIDIKLCHIALHTDTLKLFPGPAHGASGVRKMTGFNSEIAFGTILKPCTGITPDEEAEIVKKAAKNPMFLFVKEDENYMPETSFAPLQTRLRKSIEAVKESANSREGYGLIYAPHITCPPQKLKHLVDICLEEGANGIMLTDLFAGGALRYVRELTKKLDSPPALYAHNGGISVRTRHIYREVLDMFARLDGADFRQTAPITHGKSLLRPFGTEWIKCEEVLSMPLADHPATMMARAGGLDQGNIINNLMDVSERGTTDNYLFLAGSAINSIKDTAVKSDPELGARAMREAVSLFMSSAFTDAPSPADLYAHAKSTGLSALATALSQRYKLSTCT